MRLNHGRFTAIALAAALTVLGSSASADPYDVLAVRILEMADQAGRTRVAVLPYQPAGGGGRRDGEVLAARMVSRLASARVLQVVSAGVFARSLGGPERTRALGRALGVDAIVTGTYLRLGSGGLEVHTRLIDPRNSRILDAAASRIETERKEGWPFAAAEVFDTPPPEIADIPGAPLAALPVSRGELRDALSSRGPCDGWEECLQDAAAAPPSYPPVESGEELYDRMPAMPPLKAKEFALLLSSREKEKVLYHIERTKGDAVYWSWKFRIAPSVPLRERRFISWYMREHTRYRRVY